MKQLGQSVTKLFIPFINTCNRVIQMHNHYWVIRLLTESEKKPNINLHDLKESPIGLSKNNF